MIFNISILSFDGRKILYSYNKATYKMLPCLILRQKTQILIKQCFALSVLPDVCRNRLKIIT